MQIVHLVVCSVTECGVVDDTDRAERSAVQKSSEYVCLVLLTVQVIHSETSVCKVQCSYHCFLAKYMFKD